MNQSPDTEPEQNRPESPAPKKNNAWIYISIIAVLLILNIYQFTNRNTISNERDEARMERDVAVMDRDTLQSDYNAALSRLDDLVSKNAELGNQVNDRNSELSKLKNQIAGILRNKNATAADLVKAKDLIAKLNGRVKGYEERIAELEAENSNLNEYNEVITQERDSAVTSNIGLRQKAKLGAVLHISNIRMLPIDLRKNGRKEKETSRARRVDVFRISFDLDENRIIEDGVKTLFIRIIGTDGKLISNPAYGSGVTTDANNETLNYSIAKQINLVQNQKVKDVIVDWHRENEFKKGTYQIEIYHDGYKVGDGNVSLK